MNCNSVRISRPGARGGQGASICVAEAGMKEGLKLAGYLMEDRGARGGETGYFVCENAQHLLCYLIIVDLVSSPLNFFPKGANFF
jgi:hypothetical protein